MNNILGIVNCESYPSDSFGAIRYRNLGAVSFLGRYRLIDFVLSNMTNSGIDNIEVLIRDNPYSLLEQIGNGSNYNINSKRGKLNILLNDNISRSSVYNTDLAILNENLRLIRESSCEYVLIAPAHILLSVDYAQVLKAHAESDADCTLIYTHSKEADRRYQNCDLITLDAQGYVQSVEKNGRIRKEADVSLSTYLMKKDVFLERVVQTMKTSPLLTIRDLFRDAVNPLKIKGFLYEGYSASITTLEEYYEESMALCSYATARKLIKRDWPVYTKTNDSEPTYYAKNAVIEGSVISNACHIEGSIINSVIGREVTVKKGAVVRNSVIMANAVIEENTVVENSVIDKYVEIRHVKTLKPEEGEIIYVGRNEVI